MILEIFSNHNDSMILFPRHQQPHHNHSSSSSPVCRREHPSLCRVAFLLFREQDLYFLGGILGEILPWDIFQACSAVSRVFSTPHSVSRSSSPAPKTERLSPTTTFFQIILSHICSPPKQDVQGRKSMKESVSGFMAGCTSQAHVGISHSCYQAGTKQLKIWGGIGTK